MFLDLNTIQAEMFLYETCEQIPTIEASILTKEEIDVSETARSFDVPQTTDSFSWVVKLDPPCP